METITRRDMNAEVTLKQKIQSEPQPSWYQQLDLFTVVFWGTVILAFCLRFYDLAGKPFHHDESLYTTYCWRFFKGGGYQYDPMMHGPFMFHFQALLFFLFGVGDFSARISPALCGSLMVAVTYYLKDFIGKSGVLVVAIIFTLSPTYLYFSRFMREDLPVAFFTYAGVIFALLYFRTRLPKHLYLAAAAFALMFCVKENAYMHAFIFVTFLALHEICQSWLWPPANGTTTWRKRLHGDFANQGYPWFFAACIFAWIYILLYSTFFTNPGGVLDGIYRKSLTYWWQQHSIQRIKGPFHYYIQFGLLYELPVFLITIGGVLANIANSLNKKIIAGWAVVFPLFLIYTYGDRPLPPAFAITHMEIWTDLILTLWVLGIGFWATFHFIAAREPLTAFFAYWAATGFLLYSYAGEKVPWLFLHILLPVVVLAGIVGKQFWHSAKTARVMALTVGALCGLYTVHTTVLLNFYHAANPVETMVYTQTSTDIVKLLEIVREVQFKLGPEEAKKPIVAVQGNATWPMAWYLRDYEGWFYPDDLTSISPRRPIMMTDWENREKYQAVFGADYQEIRVKLREWWIPQPNAKLSDWWQYFLYRKVFNPTGSSDIAVYLKK